MALLGADYLMNLTYVPGLYVCFGVNDILLKFSNTKPNISCEGQWQTMTNARAASKNVTQLNEKLRRHFTIVVNDPDVEYPSIKETWTTFKKFFSNVHSILTYRPIWEQYFYDALKKFREDNIMYVELRSILPQLYELDGTVYSSLITAKAYRKVIKRFKKDYPDFIGAKLIYAPARNVNQTTLDAYLQLARDIKADMPDLLVGFDLVGEEDTGNPLIEFVKQLRAASTEFDYFFHAGETDWFGTTTDENLIDAILLGAKRIGHAYALIKHPILMKEVYERDIGLEVNIISNAVLSLVRDTRNHPLSVLLANNMPVVLSSDDPGAWEAEPLTDDFYVAFVGAASKLSDLKLLKQLAVNSLKYSALDRATKVEAMTKFNNKWNKFINDFDCSKY
ncbi:hypothetical protein O3G_MSEX000739 [Manduca sexta]|nr:hypothetical protein O3G_MSEX000739 [Manduca sexta]KAG6439400.1 hypothetical protein O3G_MSEX000739 [Manduca sexta]